VDTVDNQLYILWRTNDRLLNVDIDVNMWITTVGNLFVNCL
jgi:hypothetical protein